MESAVKPYLKNYLVLSNKAAVYAKPVLTPIRPAVSWKNYIIL
ncbi:hypothetical protein TREPR_1048 [Treponema primitia ZAS-2]|uniref:Uncharacterized protein n=1 Tax=Treponema primitia (strain ATCC BAA-887 / DSM 12427 / ZAS-2) TaxID=545694 RepID=F5YHM9_TREPZ|nr:hypothetical protein TREPR_1048 [Treponema primitia ZAS-2]